MKALLNPPTARRALGHERITLSLQEKIALAPVFPDAEEGLAIIGSRLARRDSQFAAKNVKKYGAPA